MIMAKPNEKLAQLQRKIRIDLSIFGACIKSYYQEFENNFQSHITIARHLNEVQLQQAKNELSLSTYCSAMISSIVLRVNEELEIGSPYVKTFTLSEDKTF